jgi:hypothetical protein
MCAGLAEDVFQVGSRGADTNPGAVSACFSVLPMRVQRQALPPRVTDRTARATAAFRRVECLFQPCVRRQHPPGAVQHRGGNTDHLERFDGSARAFESKPCGQKARAPSGGRTPSSRFRLIDRLSKAACSTESKAPGPATSGVNEGCVFRLRQNHLPAGPTRSSCRQGPETLRIVHRKMARTGLVPAAGMRSRDGFRWFSASVRQFHGGIGCGDHHRQYRQICATGICR